MHQGGAHAGGMAIEQPSSREAGSDGGCKADSPLLRAVIRGEFTVVRRLVERSAVPADVNARNSSGLTCLHIAVIRGHVKLADYLIRKGADVHARDPKGWTPLHDAALVDSRSTVRRLICKGCSPMLTTHQGELPIDVAGSIGMEKILCEEMWSKGERKLSRQYYIFLGLRFLRDPTLGESERLPASVTSRHLGLGSVRSVLASQRGGGGGYQTFTGSKPGLASLEGSEKGGPTSGLQGDNELTRLHSITALVRKPRVGLRLEDATIDRPRPLGRPLGYEYRHRDPLESSTDLINTFDRDNSSLIDFGFVPTASSVREQRRLAFSSYRSAEPAPTKSDIIVPARKRSCLRGIDTGSPPPTTRRVSFAGPELPPMAVMRALPSKDVAESSGEESQSPHTDSSASCVDTCDDDSSSIDGDSESATVTPRGSKPSSCDSQTLSEHLPSKALEQLQQLYDRERRRAELRHSDSEDSTNSDSAEVAVALLKMKPRKSSIASPSRRNPVTRRRSVTFQPEVLLQEIVTDGDAKAVSEMLESGVVSDVNKMSPAGLTALHQSAIDGNLECARALVINGANVNCTDCEAWTPLHAAAWQGHFEYVRFMLQAEADPTMKNEDGETAYDLAKTGPIRKMLLCAMNGKSPDSDDYSDGEYSGEEEEEYSHAESDSEEEEGATGSLFNSTHSKQLLHNGQPALKSAPLDNSVSPSPDLSDNVFVSGKASPVAINLLPPPASRRERELSDSTSSYGSLFEPELERIHELELEKERAAETPMTVDLDTDKVSEDQGISTMEGSSDCSHHRRGTLSEDEGTSRDVLDSDLDPESLDYRFQEAVLNFDVASLLKLSKHKDKINVNRVNKSSGITAFHHAVLEENFSLVQHLVKDYSVDLHVKDTDGWTPLHAASAVGSIRIAQFLLDNGAKASVLNDRCEFPVDVAEDKAMERLLKKAMLGPVVGKVFHGV